MDAALIASASLLGLAGAPHCTAMCSAPCAAAIGSGGRRASITFHLARVLGYAAGGAVVASSVSALSGWSQISPALRPLWVLLHCAAIGLGLWLMLKGRQPAWMSNLGRVPAGSAGPVAVASEGPGTFAIAGPVSAAPAGRVPPVAAGRGHPVRGPARAALAGGLWVAWPCGLLQSALLVAAMANGAASGAAAMAGFALASAPGLILGPWAWRRLLTGGNVAARERLAVRVAGGLLVAASAWALGHGVWQQVAAFCGLA